MKEILVVQRQTNLGWMTLDQARHRLATGSIERDAFWTDSVNFMKPGYTVHDYDLTELQERARFHCFAEESPFQDLSLFLLGFDFEGLRRRGEQLAQSEVAICLLNAHAGMSYRSKIPFERKPIVHPDDEVFDALSRQAHAANSAGFELIPNGLQLTIHAEFKNPSILDQATASILAKLESLNPAYFVYEDDLHAQSRRYFSIKPSCAGIPEDTPTSVAWRKHM